MNMNIRRAVTCILLLEFSFGSLSRADEPPPLSMPNVSEWSDYELWLAPPPRVEVDPDAGTLSPELAAMLHQKLGGGYIVDGDTDDAFTACRAKVNATLGFTIATSALGARARISGALGAGKSANAIRQAGTDYRKCVTDFYDRVTAASKLIKAQGITERSKLRIPTVGGYGANLSKLIKAIGGDHARIMLRIEAVDERLRELQNGQAEVSAALLQFIKQAREAQDAEENKRRIAEYRDTIAAAAQGVELLADIVFGAKPETRDKIVAGCRAAATILDSASILSMDNGSNDAQRAMAAMNIWGAFLSLGMMIGSSTGEDPAAHNFRVLLQGMRDLRDQMEKRFDRIEALILAANKQLNARFDRLEDKLSDLANQIRTAEQARQIDASTAASYLSFLASSNFQSKRRDCFQGIGSLALSLERYGACLNAFRDFATELAKIDAITGRSAYVRTFPDPDLAATISAPAALYQVAGLLAALEDLSGRLGSDLALAKLDPTTWAQGAEAYRAIFDRTSKDADRLKMTVRQIVDAEKPNIDDIVRPGLEFVRTIELLQTKALPISIGYYKSSATALVNDIASFYLADLIQHDLGVFERRQVRDVELRNEEDTGGYDGRHWFRPRLHLKTVWIGRAAPFDGKLLFVERDRFFTFGKVHMPQFGDGQMITYYRQVADGTPESHFDQSAPISDASKKQRMIELNQEYVAAIDFNDLTPDAKERSKESIKAALVSPALAKHFDRLKLGKAVARKAFVCMWTSDNQVQMDTQVLMETLPETAQGLLQSLAKIGDESPLMEPPGSGLVVDIPVSVNVDRTAVANLRRRLSLALAGQQTYESLSSFRFGAQPAWLLPVKEQLRALQELQNSSED